MKKRPSSIDVARHAEVSQATVSYVLSGRGDKSISEQTRAKVLQAAEELGYLPNRLAEGILRGKTSTIGVIMPDFQHSFNGQILAGLEETFAEDGYRMLIAHNRHDADIERRQVRMLLEHRVDALVAVTDEPTVDSLAAWISETRKTGVPVCVLDDLKLDGVVDTVVSSDLLGAKLAVEHLLALGHRRIAFLGASNRASTSRDRRQGYMNVLAANGIEVDASLMVNLSYRADIDEGFLDLLKVKNPPTAVFAASDGMAARAMVILREAGLSVPQDLAFVGYGELEFARYLGLTTIDQHPMEMGRQAALRVLARLKGDQGLPTTVRLDPSLVVRESCGSPRR